VERRERVPGDTGLVFRLRLALKKFLHTPGPRGYTPMDAVTMTYLAAVTAIQILAPHRPPGWGRHVLGHLGVLLAIWSLRFLPRKGPAPWRFLRDWYPILGLPVLYGEIDYLNRIVARGYYDRLIVPLEAWLFGTQPAIYLRGWLHSVVLSEYLHLSYLLYIALVPFCGLFFYVRKEWRNFELYATTILTTFFLCYLIFVFFPVAGPFYVFPRPDPRMIGILFPGVVHWMLERGSSVGAAFPSSHVAVAVSSLVIAFRLNKILFWIILPVVVGIVIGVVYGGFHYAVDALVGLAVGMLLGLLGPRIHRRIRKLVQEAEA
jgi:membrane-associated phospholipid phosphatase